MGVNPLSPCLVMMGGCWYSWVWMSTPAVDATAVEQQLASPRDCPSYIDAGSVRRLGMTKFFFFL